MKNSTILRCFLFVFVVIAALSFSIKAQKTDCSNKTDVEIIKAVYDQIRVANAVEIRHVNVLYKDGVITLEGWATTKKIRSELAKIAKKVECVKKVVNKLAIGDTGDCGAGQKECGDICIGEKQTCNICLADPMAPGCLTTEQKKP